MSCNLSGSPASTIQSGRTAIATSVYNNDNVPRAKSSSRRSHIRSQPTSKSPFSSNGSPSKSRVGPWIGCSKSGSIDPILPVSSPKNECSSRLIQIGIETEFEISNRCPDAAESKPKMMRFAEELADLHNLTVHGDHPRMKPNMRPFVENSEYKTWCVVEDPSVYDEKTPLNPFGIELVSPVFKIFPGSTWRSDVIATWRCLNEFYHIRGSPRCATHVHISLDPLYTLPQLIKIAQAVIHFEPAIGALIPAERRNSRFAKSNWLDSPFLGGREMSRAKAITCLGQITEPRAFIPIMQAFDDRNYAWNFVSLMDKKTIEFRQAPASTTADEVLAWTELVIEFVQSAVSCQSIEDMTRMPANVGGLRSFLTRYSDPSLSEPQRLEILWQRSEPDAAVEPEPARELMPVMRRAPRDMLRAKRLVARDGRHSKMLNAKRTLGSSRVVIDATDFLEPTSKHLELPSLFHTENNSLGERRTFKLKKPPFPHPHDQ